LGVRFRHIEKPASEGETRQVLARASREKLTVFPCGGGTALASGVLPDAVDVAVDTTGMDRVLALDAQNLNIEAMAGANLDRINESLGAEGKGFFLPLDPPLSGRATIGGVYAGNASGPLRLLYGTVRDQALGVRGVDALGNEVGFGGKTVKNVSGYDLTKFLAGSAGSLCLITSVSLRIYPLPESASFCEITLGGVDQVEKFLGALRASVLVPSAVVVQPAGAAFRAVAAFEGHARAVERENKDILALAREFGGAGRCQEGREAMVQALRAAVDPPGTGPDRMTLKISVPIAQGPRTLGAAGKLAHSCGVAAKLVLLGGSGVVLLHGSSGGGEIARFIKEVRELGPTNGGWTSPLHLRRDLLSGWGPRADAGLQQWVFKPIKEKLDPSGVFPPIL
ncbi:MAG TPA: FAD-binding oxidoreductase, partial [Thermodesulfobacteriota bacterium]|nr:FAD-binding oxidoreductase [Thermodesulfobacteriota bacterium]